MRHKCPGCNKAIADDKKGLKTMNGATLVRTQGAAPKLRCKCGKVVVLIKGSF